MKIRNRMEIYRENENHMVNEYWIISMEKL